MYVDYNKKVVATNLGFFDNVSVVLFISITLFNTLKSAMLSVNLSRCLADTVRALKNLHHSIPRHERPLRKNIVMQ
jgi:hypothetical protein